MISNERGQALVESAVLGLPAVLLVFGIFLWFYVEIATSWSSYWLYRANICQIQGHTEHVCKRRLLDKLGLIIARDQIKEVEIWNNHRLGYGKIVLFKSSLGTTIESRIRLPLESGE